MAGIPRIVVTPNELAPASAELLEDGQTVRLRRGSWSEDFDRGRLGGKIAFYTGLVGPMSPSARFYAPTLEVLESLRDKIGKAGLQ